MATLIEHAKQRHDTSISIEGHTNVKALPNAAPAANRGKMKPPRKPPATEKDIATNLANPTKRQLAHEFISKPMSPEVGNTCSNDLAGAKLTIVLNSISPQNMVCGRIIPIVTIARPPANDRCTDFFASMSR
mmetsp:Transcript_27438/g.39285  ORF Transcript_27438/g.39285 Transcript_27438/m.39285 type:complete len:132 (-) Transcript_27438:1222-1617(-)